MQKSGTKKSIATSSNKVPTTFATLGKWSSIIPLSNVPIHAHLLPTGDVLYWGRRKTPGALTFNSLNEHECFPFVIDPKTKKDRPIPQPKARNGTKLNLFCSSHTFLPDGKLLVAGGHFYDSQGIKETVLYDPFATDGANPWIPGPTMTQGGRWYPTIVTLPDGSALVCSGQFLTKIHDVPPKAPNSMTNNSTEIWAQGEKGWVNVTTFNQGGGDLTLFPRLHVAPDGRVFMAGTGPESFFFDPAQGAWVTPNPSIQRSFGVAEYAPSVMYAPGKVLYIGGGSPPNSMVEAIDLNAPVPAWRTLPPMHYARRQHNATILPDGTILVTGGTRGDMGPGGGGFNDVRPGLPVHRAELWDPKTEQWTILATEQVDRCYHSTAVLLADGSVLSGGGGEWSPGDQPFDTNRPKDSHANAQIFKPPYFFKGSRPKITTAPCCLVYGETFEVESPEAGKVMEGSLVRLSSVTHSFNQNQRINFLAPTLKSHGVLAFKAPVDSNVCPPGHYILFILDHNRIPSVGKIVKVMGQPKPKTYQEAPQFDPVAANKRIISHAKNPEIAIGLTSTCPYGCWGNALTILANLKDVKTVRPVVNAIDSVLYVYLNTPGLPDILAWKKRFHLLAHDSYEFRGVEIEATGTLESSDSGLILTATPDRPSITLAPLTAASLVQLRVDRNGSALPPLRKELVAFAALTKRFEAAASTFSVTIKGPLHQTLDGYILEVRECK